MKKIVVNTLDEKAYGQEPDPASIVSESDYAKAYSFYNYNCSRSDFRKFLDEYLKQIKADKTTLRELAAAEDSAIPPVYAWLLRMHVRGVVHNAKRVSFIKKKTDALREIGREKISAKKALSPIIDIQDRMRMISGGHIAEIDEQIDAFTETGYKNSYSFYDLFRRKEAKSAHMHSVIEHFKPLAEELALAVKGKDLDINEGYHNLSKKKIQALFKFVNAMLEDCKTISSNQRKSRSPTLRKIKVKTADQITKNIRCQKSDPLLKLVSINAVNLVGASEVWTFNTKYCVMSRYVAIDRGGISVRGTSLINFDETASEKRKIRKPEKFLPTMLSDNAKTAFKKFSALSTKAAACNGRINEFTIILRATK